jgi:pyruvate dehydrogenase E2 component (dihydrolipoamide acetyltransferase)
MPKLSPTMEEGMIAKWHKRVGEHVAAGDLILEVATDKATVEHSALDAGWLRKVLIEEGGEAVVNQPIAIMTESQEESIEGYVPEGAQPKSSTIEPPPPKKEEASTSSKATEAAALPAPQEKTTAVPTPASKEESSEPEIHGDLGDGRVFISPLARRLAKVHGLDLSTVKGSGPNGRIMSRDLSNALPASQGGRTSDRMPNGTVGAYAEETLTPMRKTIAKRLQEAKATIPHFYVSLKIDAGPLNDLREQLKKHEFNATINDFLVKACGLALRKHPGVNSGYNSAQNTLIRFKTIDISIAVSLKEGLITPIVRFADYKSIQEISSEVRSLVKKAKEGKLESHEYVGGSFTISNLGMYGVSNFTAIINPPQGAILAISGIEDVPVVRAGQIVAGKVMTLTLSADHRVMDGVAGAEFLKSVQGLLEAPAILLT